MFRRGAGSISIGGMLPGPKDRQLVAPVREGGERNLLDMEARRADTNRGAPSALGN